MWLWRFAHRRDVTILYVHGVMDSDDRASWIPLRPQLPPRRLAAAIRELSRHYRFVSLADAVDMLSGRTPVAPYSVVLTFDDGYRNNITHALPILRRHRVPATFFLATGHIEHRRPFWFDRLDYALQHAPVAEMEVQVGPATVRLRAGDRGALRGAYKQLRDVAKALPRHDREMQHEMEGIAARLEAESDRKLADVFEEDAWSAVLTWEEVRQAAGDDVSFGSHTVDHIRLGLVDAEMISDQLVRSKEMIEARTGRPCRHFAYPSGSFTPQAAAIARASGYTAAVTTDEGANRMGDDLMTLRRIGLPDTGNMTEVLARVSGLSLAISGLSARLRAAARGGDRDRRRPSGTR